MASSDTRNTDPYAWLRELARLSPVIHVEQSTKDKSAHWPFMERCDEIGIISSTKAIGASGAKEVILLLEFSHWERYSTEYQVIDDLKKSLEYWKKYIKE